MWGPTAADGQHSGSPSSPTCTPRISAGTLYIRQELDPCGGDWGGGDPDSRQPGSMDEEDFSVLLQ